MSKKKFGDSSLTRKIAELSKQALANEHVVNLNAYRQATIQVKTKTILVVDDEPIVRGTIKKVFENEKYHVITAKDAMELSKIIETTRLDLILLDLQLPWVNGFEICSLIKTNPDYRNLPIAIISGNKNEDDIRKGFDVGCDEYIAKPFEIDDLKQVVQKLLLRSG